MKRITAEINEYLDYCENIRQMSKITLLNKQCILTKFARDTKIDTVKNLTNHIYNSWLRQEFAAHIAPSSINIYASTILCLLKFQKNNGLEINFNFNNISHFKAVGTARKFYTRKEIEQVLKYVDDTDALMIKILAETGMRIAELVSLKVENLDKTKITFIGKGAKSREVYINIETLKALQNYLGRYQIQEGSLWQVVGGVKTKNSQPPTVATVRKNLQKAFERAGFEGFYPHALRHSFATDLQKKGASVSEIKEMMGHSSIATTERYLHDFEGRLEELFNKYH